jgi:DNA-binding FrmR family transcriptional regulator
MTEGLPEGGPYFLLAIYPVGVYNNPGGETMEDEKLCPCRKKMRSDEEMKDLMNRLSRIEGQIRGIRRMLEEDAYCIDVLNQVSAASSALGSFSRVLLTNHIRTCVVNDVKDGNEEKLEELVKTLGKFMK